MSAPKDEYTPPNELVVYWDGLGIKLYTDFANKHLYKSQPMNGCFVNPVRYIHEAAISERDEIISSLREHIPDPSQAGRSGF